MDEVSQNQTNDSSQTFIMMNINDGESIDINESEAGHRHNTRGLYWIAGVGVVLWQAFGLGSVSRLRLRHSTRRLQSGLLGPHLLEFAWFRFLRFLFSFILAQINQCRCFFGIVAVFYVALGTA